MSTTLWHVRLSRPPRKTHTHTHTNRQSLCSAIDSSFTSNVTKPRSPRLEKGRILQSCSRLGVQPAAPAGCLLITLLGWLGFWARAQLTRWQTLCLNWQLAALLCYCQNLPVNFKQTKEQTLQLWRQTALRLHQHPTEQLPLRFSLDLMTLQRCKHTAEILIKTRSSQGQMEQWRDANPPSQFRYILHRFTLKASRVDTGLATHHNKNI